MNITWGATKVSIMLTTTVTFSKHTKITHFNPKPHLVKVLDLKSSEKQTSRSVERLWKIEV